MTVLQEKQFGPLTTPKHHAIPFRTLTGDLIDARGRLQAEIRNQRADAETPTWLLPAKYQPKH